MFARLFVFEGGMKKVRTRCVQVSCALGEILIDVSVEIVETASFLFRRRIYNYTRNERKT